MDPRIRGLARTESEESLFSPIFVGNIDNLFDDAGENSPAQKPAKSSDLVNTSEPKLEQSKDGVYIPPTKKLKKAHYKPDNTPASINHTLHTLTMRLKKPRELLPKAESIAGKN
ncbi:hypothetical protein PoHVEF18_004971 [Penicillium ochrochloron]